MKRCVLCLEDSSSLHPVGASCRGLMSMVFGNQRFVQKQRYRRTPIFDLLAREINPASREMTVIPNSLKRRASPPPERIRIPARLVATGTQTPTNTWHSWHQLDAGAFGLGQRGLTVSLAWDGGETRLRLWAPMKPNLGELGGPPPARASILFMIEQISSLPLLLSTKLHRGTLPSHAGTVVRRNRAVGNMASGKFCHHMQISHKSSKVAFLVLTRPLYHCELTAG